MSFEIIKKISDLIESEIPGFIRENYSNFTFFLKAYFEWLESRTSSGRNFIYGTQQLLNLADVDKTESDFFQYFEKEFIPNIPKQALCDRVFLLKNIKQFYKTRGSEASFRLIFRILYLNEIGFYYPITNTLFPDSGAWVEEKSIRTYISVSSGDLEFDVDSVFLGQKIIGTSSGASAVVARILKYPLPGRTIYELIFQKNSLYKVFFPFEKVIVDSPLYKLKVQPVLTQINIVDAGQGYSLGDIVTITNPYGIIMKARISNIGDLGEVQDVTIIEQGLNYPTNDSSTIVITFPTKLHQATATATLGTVFVNEGRYLNSSGFLDNVDKVRDDYYYQEFSYQINSEINYAIWSDTVKKLLHPAGMIVFNNLQLISGPIVAASSVPEHSAEYRITLRDTFLISGTIIPADPGDSVENITVNLTGDASASVLTDEDGYYEFANLHNGSYTITPSSEIYNFNPTHIDVILHSEDLINNDFIATEILSISGTMSVDGIPQVDVPIKLSALDISGFSANFDCGLNTALLDDHYIYIGGDFQKYRGQLCRALAKFDIETGTLDPYFDTTTGVDDPDPYYVNVTTGNIYKILKDSDDLYICGEFTKYKGVDCKYIARISSLTASLDTTFDTMTGFNAPVKDIIKSGNYLYCIGDFTTYKGISANHIAKIDLTTMNLDSTFDPGNGFGLNGFFFFGNMILDGNDLYIGANFTSYKGTTRYYLVKINATTGVVDSTFNTSSGFNDAVYKVIKDGNDLYCIGDFTSYKGSARQRIAKINATTAALDVTFDSANGFDDSLMNGIEGILKDGDDLYVGGWFTTYKGVNRERICKIDANTAALDLTFNAGLDWGTFIVFALPLAKDETTLYVGGNFSEWTAYPSVVERLQFARINSENGSILGSTEIVQINNTDQDGQYKFTNLVPNTEYCIKPPPYSWPIVIPNLRSDPELIIVSLENDSIGNIDFTALYDVYGYISLNNNPLGNIEVDLYEGDTVIRTALTPDNYNVYIDGYNFPGWYFFRNVPRGDYRIEPADNNYDFSPGAYWITIDNISIEYQDFIAVLATFTYDVYTKDLMNEVIPGVQIVIETVSGIQIPSPQYTDQNGYCQLEVIAPGGIYNLTATLSGYFFNDPRYTPVQIIIDS